MGTLLVTLVFVLAILFCALVVKMFTEWSGLWRISVWIPLLTIMGVVLNIAIAIGLNPTSHNLWPFELLFWLAMALASIGVLYLLRWISHRLTV